MQREWVIDITFRAVSEKSFVGGERGVSQDLFHAEERKGSKDSGANFQGIFLRLKIGLTLELSWEKGRTNSVTYKLFVLKTITSRLRDTDGWANTAWLFQPQVFLRSHLKAVKVTTDALQNVPSSPPRLRPQDPYKLTLPWTGSWKRAVKKGCRLWSQPSQFIHLTNTRRYRHMAGKRRPAPSPGASTCQDGPSNAHMHRHAHAGLRDMVLMERLEETGPAGARREGNSFPGETHSVRRNWEASKDILDLLAQGRGTCHDLRPKGHLWKSWLPHDTCWGF